MAPLPAAPIDKAIAGTSVPANVIVSRFLDHQPLHRQEDRGGPDQLDRIRAELSGSPAG